MENNTQTNEQSKHNSRRRGSGASRSTSSFKHVNVPRERPHLTRGGCGADAASAEGGGKTSKASGTRTRRVRQDASSGASSGKGSSAQGRQTSRRTSGSGSKARSSAAGAPKRRPSTGSVARDPRATLEIIPLGGLDAIGKNMTVFKCAGDMILDDAGIMFPDDGHPGVDLILPDYTYVLENADALRGIIVTHGHEDHTGSLPYLMKDLDRTVPIYASKLTLGLIEGKFAEHKIKNAKLIEVKPGDTIKLGCMKVTFFAVNHSIPGAMGAFFESPAGNVLHMGDFKLDQTPIDGHRTDFAALTRFGEQGVDLMLSDSTNATVPGYTPSEAEVGPTLKNVIEHAKGRVVIASFASHIHRMQQICDAAVANGRKVVVTGRSMIQNTDIARKLGYLHIKDDDLIDAYELNNIPADKVVIMCTGSQGEPLSALGRIANGEHKTIDIEPGDTVIISATPVPGNEKAVTKVVNMLAKMGVEVFDKSRGRVHVSGHASAEELKLVLAMVHPHAFVPVHGEATHLRAHAKLAEAMGVDPNEIFIVENGDTLKLKDGKVTLGDPVQAGIVYVDGLSVGDTSQSVLDERVELGSMGVASVSVAVSFARRALIGTPVVEMRGITGGDTDFLSREAARVVTNAVQSSLRSKDLSMRLLRKAAREAVNNMLWDAVKQRPMIVVNILEV